MLAACTWNAEPINCSHLFSDVATGSGGTCSFNQIPSNLSRKHASIKTEIDLRNRPLSEEEITAWKLWKLDDSGDKMFVETNMTYGGDGGRNISVPDAQEYCGQRFGLQFILKFDEKESFCQSSQTNGVKVA